jgi:hypothetical protein
MRKFKVYNYDISLKIVLFLQHYNNRNGTKFKITASALNRLDKFITILAKTIFINSCLISLHKNRSSVYYWTTKHITEIVLRGYEINIGRFKQEYDLITNPLNDFGKSSLDTYTGYGTRYYDYRDAFKDSLDQILSEMITVYGEGRLIKGEQDLSGTIVVIILCILDMCVPSVAIVTNEILCKVADLEDIIKIDNVLGGNDILKFDTPNFEEVSFEEIRIDDLTEDDIEEKIENVENYKIRYKGYPFNLNELVVD